MMKERHEGAGRTGRADLRALKEKFKKPVLRELTPEEKRARAEKKARIRAIAREYEAKRRATGLKAPVIRRGFGFYGGMILVLVGIGAVVIDTASETGGRKRVDRQTVEARNSVNNLAEALGRFRFHTGRYPDAADGLGAIFRNDTRYASKYPGWLGRYVRPHTLEQNPDPDPWKRPYVYEPPAATNGVPTLLSLGADGRSGTADDIRPDPARFARPFRDTTWTNDWAPFWKRGITVIPSKTTGKTYRYVY